MDDGLIKLTEHGYNGGMPSIVEKNLNKQQIQVYGNLNNTEMTDNGLIEIKNLFDTKDNTQLNLLLDDL